MISFLAWEDEGQHRFQERLATKSIEFETYRNCNRRIQK